MNSFNPRASAIRRTLRNNIPELSDGLRGRVIKHLIAAGHAVDDLLETDTLHAAASAKADVRISGAFDDGAEIRAAAVGKPYLERVHAHMDSSESAKSAFRFGMGQLSQHGIALHDFVDDTPAKTLHKLDQIMSSREVPNPKRFSIKTAFARCSLID